MFLDTSVLVAAFSKGHPHHLPSFQLFSAAAVADSCCALHTLAELYSVMSGLPLKPPVPADQVFLFVEEVRARLSLVALDETEYFATIRNVASLGFRSGRVYDALLLRCAEKSAAQLIYTWNLKHFQALAPQLSSRIRTP
jgi:predicted nucleic acid-binding protein